MKSFPLLLLTLLITSTAINAGDDKYEKPYKPSQTFTQYVNRQMFNDVTGVPVDQALHSLRAPLCGEPQPNVSVSPIARTASIAIASSRSPSIRPLNALNDFLPSSSPLTTPQNSLNEEDVLPKFSRAFLAKISNEEKNNEDKDQE
jgi:hypothetical protein